MTFSASSRRYAAPGVVDGLGVPVMMAGADQGAIDEAVFAAVRDDGNQTVIMTDDAATDIAAKEDAEPTQVARAAQENFVPVSLTSTERTEAAILAAVNAAPTPSVAVQAAAIEVPDADAAAEAGPAEPRVIVRDTTDPRQWSVQVGAYRTRYQAEKQLLRTALADLRSLDGALREVDSDIVHGERFYRARFVGLSQTDATKACVRLIARNESCVPIGPGT